MKRCKASVWILLSLILLCIVSLIVLRQQCMNYLYLTNAVETAVDQGNTEQALSAFDELEQQWQQYHDITGIFVNGDELDAVRQILCGLRPLLENEHPEAKSELQKIRYLIESIYQEELPELWHIL